MFINVNDEIFRVIATQDELAWIISYENPTSPKRISINNLKEYNKIEIPKSYIKTEFNEMTAAQKARYELIQDLLKDDIYIRDKNKRNEMAKLIAEKKHTTKKRILRLYYRYLAKKDFFEIKKCKKKKEEKYSNYDWAIKKFHFSAKQMTLRDSYEMMLFTQYTDGNGKLAEDKPTWDSFRHYYYDNGYNMNPQKDISRKGLTWYQRNVRPIIGNATTWKDGIGHYQMDATEADIYLVSKLDKSIIIGRPNIYLAVDTRTQLIAGIYVGLSADDTAVMSCLANAAENKVKYCKRYGITISPEQWPSKGLPSSIITDQGKEFVGKRLEELCIRYGVEIENLPPFRPDQKSLVEKTFDIMQSRYKPILRGKGIVGLDAQERWAVDYRGQATLNLEEFTRIIIHCVIYINNRLLKNYSLTASMIENHIVATSAKLWSWFEHTNDSQIIPIDEYDIYYMCLKRKSSIINRKGIKHNGFWYVNENIGSIMRKVKNTKKVMIAYDVNDISCVYLIENAEYIPFYLSKNENQYNGLCDIERKMIQDKIKKQNKEYEEVDIASKINMLNEIQDIVDEAEIDKNITNKEKVQGKKIKDAKKREKDLLL